MYQKKDMVVNPQHFRRLIQKQTMDAENVLLEQGKLIQEGKNRAWGIRSMPARKYEPLFPVLEECAKAME